MKGKQFIILVKDLSLLEKYGFEKREKNYSWQPYKNVYEYCSGSTDRNGKKISSIRVHDNDNKVYMQTCGGAALKVLCEMYKDGVINFFPHNDNFARIKKKRDKIKKLQKEIEALRNGTK